MASIDPPVNTVSVPGRVPPAVAIGITSGSCDGSTPMASSISVFHFPPDMEVAHGGGDTGVDGRHPGERVGGHRLAGPVTLGVGRSA